MLASVAVRGGRIAWGALDAGERPDPGLALARIERAWTALRARGVDDPASASLVSATCGTGGRSVQAERGLARALRRAAAIGRGEPLPDPVAATAEAAAATESAATAEPGATAEPAAAAGVQDDS